jgi:FAD/FMN-containing dehydrogenase/Fe-S oxidoreductase
MFVDVDTRSLEADLQRHINGEVRFDAYSRALYSTDASIYQINPIGLVVPLDASDVAAAVEICAQNSVPILPRGGGTSLSGQTVNRAVVLDFTKYMNQVVEINPEEGFVRAQPGITLDELNRQLYPYGLHFPPDPTTSNRATVGGAIGNNSCGAHSIMYGKTSDHVKGTSVILSDGTVTNFQPTGDSFLNRVLKKDDLEGRLYRDIPRIAQEQCGEIERRFPKIMRRVSGYNLDLVLSDKNLDLSRLVVGSEGTLCIVTEADLGLKPLPQKRTLAVLHFRSLAQAMEATVQILEHQPSSVELIDQMLLNRARSSLGFSRRLNFIEGDPQALLLVEFFGDSDQELNSRVVKLENHMKRAGLSYFCVRAVSDDQQADVWAIRKAGLGLLMSIKGDTKPLPFVEDTAVSPEALPEYIRRFDEIIRFHDTTAGYYGHASVGCLHIRPLINIKLQAGLDKLVSIAEAVSDLVLEFGGSNSGEHGDGIVRGVFSEKMFGPKIYEAFRKLKHTFDPNNIMNPGKIIDCPPMTQNLRIGPSYRTLKFDTKMDFSEEGGFARAVELCNGVGACRKVGGTMCPSYMVTREEEHSTRGRANLLRSILSGALPHSEFTGKRLRGALDLCLECKGCKAECPSNVDMAKLKSEFLAHYNEVNGVPIRSRLFGNIARFNERFITISPLINLLSSNRLVRWILHVLLGIHYKRRLPPLARESFHRWFGKRIDITSGSKGSVVLFHDTFMDYNKPEIGYAAVEILEAAGYQVILPDKVCCGRPMISKGMLDKARENARINVDALYHYAEAGIPIIGCEPSCLFTLRDEYPDLLRDDRSAVVARQSVLFEEFLVSLHDSGQLDLVFRENPKKILFHGHCHQKALSSVEASLKALRLLPGSQVDEINAGCCGMAGAFGYEREHYNISMSIGEQSLFPIIRLAPEAQIVVNGFSCLNQLLDGTGRRPYHIVEILREALQR